MKDLLWYVFNPNPGHAEYAHTWVIAALVACAALIVVSVGIRFWRRTLQSAVTKKLTKSWSMATLWFGISGLFLMICRVEGIQFLATRVLWGVWGILALLYVFIQFRLFTARHYEVMPRITKEDPLAKYLPGKKRK
jgi:hypothetical protein